MASLPRNASRFLAAESAGSGSRLGLSLHWFSWKWRLECGVYPVHISKFNAIIWTRKRFRSNTNVFYFLMIHSKLCNFETQWLYTLNMDKLKFPNLLIFSRKNITKPKAIPAKVFIGYLTWNKFRWALNYLKEEPKKQ